LSRAALYRLFEPDGGLAHFVQQHRLHRAFAMLTSSAYRHWRIIDIALNPTTTQPLNHRRNEA